MAQSLAVRILLTGKDRVSKAANKARGAINKLGNRGTATFRAIQTAAIAAGGAIATYLGGRAVIGAFRAVVGEASDLESAMARIQAVTGETDEGMQRLRETAVELGETTEFKATEAAGAIENLGRAGLSTAENIETIPRVLQLATATGLGLAEAASTVTKTINGMGLEFADSKRVVDTLVKTTQSADTTVRKLSQGFSQVAPDARAAGLSMEDTAAVVAKLQESGLDATRAGTALRQVLIQIGDAGSPVSEALTEAGIRTRDFFEVLDELNKGGERVEKVMTAMPAEAVSGMRLLASEGGAALKAFSGELANSEGAAENAASVIEDTLRKAARRLGSAWNTLKRQIGDPIIDPVRREVERLTTAIADLNESGKLQQIGEAMADTFRKGAKAVRAFLSDYTVDEVIGGTSAKIRELGEQFNRVFAAIKLGANGIAAIWNFIQGVVGGVIGAIGHAVASLGQRFADLASVMERVGLISEATAEKVQRHVNALKHASTETARYGQESLKDALENGQAMGEALATMTSGHKDAADAASEHGDAEEDAAADAEKATASFKELADITDGVTDALKRAEKEAVQEKVSAALREQADAARQRAAEAKDHLDDLRASSTATQDEINKAQYAYRKATIKAAQATDRLAEESGEAQGEAEALKQAMENLGLETQASLDEAAASARASFTTVADSAESTRASVERAFTAYAEKAVKANNGVVSSELKATAAAHGLTGALEGMGEQAEESGEKAKAAMDEAADAGEKASQAVNDADVAARRSASGAGAAMREFIGGARDKYRELSEAAGAAFDQAIQKAAEMNGLVGGFFDRLAQERDRIEQQVASETASLEKMQRTIEASKGSTAGLAQIASMTTDQFELLGDKQLSGVRQAIQSAQRDLDRMRDSAEGTLDSLQDELLQLQGREDELARRRNERRREELQGQLAQAQAAGDGESTAKLREALRTLDKISTVEQQKRRADERERAEQQRQAQAAGDGPKQTIELRGPDGGSATVEADEGNAQSLIEQLNKVGLRTQ